MIIAQTPTIIPISVQASSSSAIVRNLNAEFTCPAVTTFMAPGDTHDPIQVANVQAILRKFEGLDVDPTGVFDEKTDIAVKAFQKKYTLEVLNPWGASIPSGLINITTAKKINNIACGIPMTLNAEELAIINTFRARVARGETVTDNGYIVPSAVVPVGITVPAAPNAPIAPYMTAGAADASATGSSTSPISTRFWKYIKGLFR